jgi:hypothetical protein
LSIAFADLFSGGGQDPDCLERIRTSPPVVLTAFEVAAGGRKITDKSSNHQPVFGFATIFAIPKPVYCV